MSDKNKGFIPSEMLTKWVRWFLYIQILVAVSSLVSGVMEYQFYIAVESGMYTSDEQLYADAGAHGSRQELVAMTYLIVFVVSGIVILKWIYRANYNVRQLGAENMKFSPGWSVGWYFIPIFTLWKPYQAMKEIWKASGNPGDWNGEKAGAILSWWWFFWLLNNFLGQAFMRMSSSAVEIGQLKNANIVYQVSDVVSIILAVVTLKLVNGIYQRQMEHYGGKMQTAY